MMTMIVAHADLGHDAGREILRARLSPVVAARRYAVAERGLQPIDVDGLYGEALIPRQGSVIQDNAHQAKAALIMRDRPSEHAGGNAHRWHRRTTASPK